MATERVPGINRSALWSAWKEVRRLLKRSARRDVLDYLEYDIDPDVWIKRLLSNLDSEDYVPERPVRYSVAKKKGFDRIISVPAIPDLVLYRAIVDRIYVSARKQQVKHAYFNQATLSNVTSDAVKQAKSQMEAADAPYFTSKSSFLEWLKYDQYRKHLIFEKVYPFIVVTDITNFFDSVLYNRVEESLYGLPAKPRLVSLLFHILETLSLREGLVPVQRIGLPVDPVECSRVLAHMALFPHDRRMVNLVGDDAYVRWMDDQNFGVNSRAEGYRVLGHVGDSLRRLHLTANSGKSMVLSLAEAKQHFHFVTNAALDQLDKMPHGTRAEQAAMRKALTAAWNKAKLLEGVGEWEKILKRFYRQAARARWRVLLKRAPSDLVVMPSLVERIGDYVRYVSKSAATVAFVEDVLKDEAQVYPDVNYQLLESLLKISPDDAARRKLLKLGSDLIKGTRRFRGSTEARPLGPLMILRFGDGRSVKSLFRLLDAHGQKLPQEVMRSVCAVVGGCKLIGFNAVQTAASTLLRNHLSEFVRLVLRVRDFTTVPGRFKTRVRLDHDSITGSAYVDMRALLAARLLGLSTHTAVRAWLAVTKKNHLSEPISKFEVKLINRLWPADDHGM